MRQKVIRAEKSNFVSNSEDHLRRTDPKQLKIGHRFTAITPREEKPKSLAIGRLYLADWKTIDKKLVDLAQQRLSNIQNYCDYYGNKVDHWTSRRGETILVVLIYWRSKLEKTHTMCRF